jgi:hypothetical protein
MALPALLALLVTLCASCARSTYVRSPDPFRPLAPEAVMAERQSYFQRQKVHVVGANEIQVGGQSFDATEALRYYDDSRSGDASALQQQACAKVLRAEDWAFYGTTYGAILGVLIGGLHSYLTTQIWDFAAMTSAAPGALRGLGVGMLSGMAVGWTMFGVERMEARDAQRQAASEFNHMARVMLKIGMAPLDGGGKAEIYMEY